MYSKYTSSVLSYKLSNNIFRTVIDLINFLELWSFFSPDSSTDDGMLEKSFGKVGALISSEVVFDSTVQPEIAIKLKARQKPL